MQSNDSTSVPPSNQQIMYTLTSRNSDDHRPDKHPQQLTRDQLKEFLDSGCLDIEDADRVVAYRKARRAAEEAEAERRAATHRANNKVRQRARRKSIAELGYCDPDFCANYRAEHAAEMAPVTARDLVARAEREPVVNTERWLSELRATEDFSRHIPVKQEEFVRRINARGERTEMVRQAHSVILGCTLQIEMSQKGTLLEFVNYLHLLKLEPVMTEGGVAIRYADGSFIEDYGGASERLGRLLDLLIGGGGQYTAGTPWYDMAAMRLHYLKRSNRTEDIPKYVLEHIVEAFNSLPHDVLIGAVDAAFDANPLPGQAAERLAHLVGTLHNRLPNRIAATLPEPPAAVVVGEPNPGEVVDGDQGGVP